MILEHDHSKQETRNKRLIIARTFFINFLSELMLLFLVVLEEHVSYNDSQSAYNPTTNLIRKVQNKERIGKKIAIRDRF